VGLASLHSLSTWVAPPRKHLNSLGSELSGAYRHLLAPAGAASRPPAISPEHVAQALANYDAPAAPEDSRVSHMAAFAVDQLLAQQLGRRTDVRFVFSTQCTLDQQILASTCLRVCHEHFPQPVLARTFSQMGTAGIPTVLRLAAMHNQGPGRRELACITASDKWIAPFVRSFPNLVVHGDASAACLVGQLEEPGIARIEAIKTVLKPWHGCFWSASSQDLGDHLVGIVHKAINAVRGDARVDAIVGDQYLGTMEHRVAALTGLAGLPLSDGEGPARVHLSSASPLFAISRAIEASVHRGEPMRVIVWTASLPGFGGAIRLLIQPTARRLGSVWMPESDETSPPPERFV